MTIFVDFMGGNGQKSFSDSEFVTRIPRNNDIPPTTPSFSLKTPNFKDTVSTDISPKMSKNDVFGELDARKW